MPKKETSVKLRKLIFGLGCWLVASGATAISLGQSRGSVILGAPVDLAFDVQPDAGADLASSCITADVAFGDSAVADNKIRVTFLADSPGRSPAVRVQVAGSVNEPVVTVTVSVGCSGNVTRAYTFLADPPAAHVPGRIVNIDQLASAPAAVARDSGAGADRTVSPPAVRRRAQASVEPREQGEAAAAAPLKPPAAKPAARIAPPRTPRVVARKATENEARTAKAVAPERSRLVMEPLDALAEPSVALRPSADMGAVPAQASASQRQEAAVAWKALNTPEAVPRDDERVRALEAEMAVLRAKSTAERTSVAELQQRLALIESQRFPAGVVHALLALLVLVSGLLAWVWARARRDAQLAMHAWRDSVALSAKDGDAGAHDPHGLRPHPHDTWAPEESSPFGEDTYILPSEAEPFSSSETPAPATPEHAQTRAPAAAAGFHRASSPHLVNPEELFDIQQQAEFFVSVGEHEQAVEVMRRYIADHQETSPSAYQELLWLYHKLGRSDDFSRLREQFSRHFNVQVPAFSAFSHKGRTLEDYLDALAAIEAEWTSSSVVRLLEKFLFRRDGSAAVAPFDLAAFDDLLLLLAIAQTTPASARGAPPPRLRTTPLASPLDHVAPVPATGQSPAPAVDLPLDSLAAGLEFDFGQHAPAAGLPGKTASPPSAGLVAPKLALDLDLSDPPQLTLSDLPPVPVTAAPRPGQPVGFGMANDLMELRLELEQRKTDPKV